MLLTIELVAIPVDEGGGYSACVPALGSWTCVGDGETPQAAVNDLFANFQEEIEISLKKGIVSAEPPGVVAEMLALAEEGRKWAKREINDLLTVADYLPDKYWQYTPDGHGVCLTTEGRERLAFLRGLVGEEKPE